MALTVYVGHVLLGMGALEAMGRLGSQTLLFSLAAAAVFIIVAVVLAGIWRRFHRRGPMEWLIRLVGNRGATQENDVG